ncbi:MAG: DUF5317 domain-containing protein [Carboxydocellales bacterium]
MFISSLVLGVIIGMLTKKDIRTLTKLPIKAIYLPFIAFGSQYCLDVIAASQFGGLQDWLGIVHSASYLLLFWWIYLNRSLSGIWWIAGGTLLNFLVIIANQGFMPVDPGRLPEEVRLNLLNGLNGTHRLLSADSALYFLADIFYLSWPFQELDSIGDVLLAAGAGIVLFRGMQNQPNSPDEAYHLETGSQE